MRMFRSAIVLLPLAALAACAPDGPAALTAAGEPSEAALAPVCVRFDVPALGDSLGAPMGHAPGTVVFAENGINVSLHTFFHPGGGSAYGRLDIVNTTWGGVPFGAGKFGLVNNINVGFDFSGLPFVPTKVDFDWLDFGGHENLKVNGSGIWIGELTASPSPMGGAAVGHVITAAAFPAWKKGVTTLTGPVKRFAVGGQELYIDNICAYP